MKNSLFAILIACTVLTTSCKKNEEALTLASQKSTLDHKKADASQNKAGIDIRQTYYLNENTSVAEWKGQGPAASHQGAFTVKGQNIEVVNGKIKGGSFTIPIASIQNFNLPDHIKPVLLEHLKSPDFFNILMYPEAGFVIKRVTPLPNPGPDAVAGANYRVTGEFTMIGKTNEITFPARITMEGNTLAVEATFKIDRTKWGMNYAADPALGEHHIYPQVDLHLKLQGSKQ
jgi:polyisoprenoid-binding protein YceI